MQMNQREITNDSPYQRYPYMWHQTAEMVNKIGNSVKNVSIRDGLSVLGIETADQPQDADLFSDSLWNAQSVSSRS